MVLVFVMLFAIVIASTGATLGVLMTLFSFANCLGDIVLCIIPFFLRKKYPHACRHAGFTMPLWVLYAMSVFAIVVAAYLSYSALLTLGATVWLLLAIFAVVFVAYVLLRIAYLKRQGRDLMAELKAPYTPLRRARGRVRRHGRGQVKKLPILTTPYIESTPADHPPGCSLASAYSTLFFQSDNAGYFLFEPPSVLHDLQLICFFRKIALYRFLIRTVWKDHRAVIRFPHRHPELHKLQQSPQTVTAHVV